MILRKRKLKQIIKKPLISEKSFTESSNGKFIFSVDKNISKIDAKKYIEEIFKVNVVKVNSVKIQGKVKRTKNGLGKRSDIKKMIFQLKKNQKIALFEAEKEEKPQKADKSAKKASDNKK